MSRTRRPVPAPSEPSPAPAAGPLEGRLVGYRLVRRIASGTRADVYLAAADPGPAVASAGPVTGSIEAERTATALVVLRVYQAGMADDGITREIEAMSADATNTLPSLIDVANLEDGRCCLVVERLGGRPLSRLLAERRLSPGEAVTILAPLVVAVGELARMGFVHDRLAPTDVVLDEDGRPRLLGLGALRRLPDSGEARSALQRTGHEALADLIDEVASAVAPAGALESVTGFVRGRLASRPFQPCEEEVERHLFAAAAAEPVRGFLPRAAPRVTPSRAIPPAPRDAVSRPPHEPPRRESGAGASVRRALALLQGPDELLEQLAEAADLERPRLLRARIRDAVGRRRGALVVGGLVGGGALVLLLTMVPPAPSGRVGDRASASETLPREDDGMADSRIGSEREELGPVTAEADAHGAAVGGGDGSPGSAAAEGSDPVQAARWLLERRATCFETLDLGCLSAVDQPGSAIEAADRDALALARDGSASASPRFDPVSIELAADMGGAVLLHAQTAGEREPASLLMVRGEAGWRLRDVFD
jgi:hypothetical protein